MREFAESRYDRFLEDLETVVNIDSGSGYAPGLMEVSSFFQHRFERLGWPTHLLQFNEGAVPCLEIVNGRLPAESDRFDFLFLGHMDTVFPQGTVSQRPFSMQQGRAFGPGVADMKGGLVTVLCVAEILQQTGLSRDLSFCIAFNSDEEVGTRGSQKWLEGLAARSERVLVFEPCRPGGQRVLQRKGVGFFEVICSGRAVHAGVEPEKGANAVLELAHQVIKVSGFGRPEMGTTVNVTTIAGGNAINVIPASAQSTFDVRFSSVDEMHRIKAAFRDLSASGHVEGIRVEVKGDVNRPPMVPGSTTLELWDSIAAIGESLGMKMSLTDTGGGSDGNFTAAMGIPTIDAMGPRGGSPHSDGEYLELDSVVPNIQLICEILAAAASGALP
jgi:glutamate carboxypeptidase